MTAATILGLIPAKGNLPLILFNEAVRLGLPWAQQIAHDPSGAISRVGDVLVWNSSNGQQVLAGVASLTEGQSRIEQVVNHIESVQLGVSHTLGVMHTLSIATLGISSLTGAYMVWRLQSLAKRFDKLSEAVKDVDDNLDAQNKAHLQMSVQKLREFDTSADLEVVEIASSEGQHAANIYGTLAWSEASKKQPRIDVLNYRSRCYFLGLMAELQSRILLEQLSAAITRVNDEKPRLQSIAKSIFDAVIQNRPESYLRAEMAKEGVTLEVMAELYRFARHAGAITEPEIESAGQLFEHCRTKGISSGRAWSLRTSTKQDALRLRYLMACLEEINRVEGLRLLMSEVLEKKIPLPSLTEQIRDWWATNVARTAGAPESVIAYCFA